MNPNLFFIALSIFIFSCNQPGRHSNTLNKAWLDSIIKSSDSSYVKPYYRSDFVTAWYYINKKDSTLCQLMKDSTGIIRQIIVTKKDIRTYFASYYANGRLQVKLLMDEFGQYHGSATYYYKDGSIQSNGAYLHGLKTGQWKNFDTKNKLVSTDNYNNGQAIP